MGWNENVQDFFKSNLGVYLIIPSSSTISRDYQSRIITQFLLLYDQVTL